MADERYGEGRKWERRGEDRGLLERASNETRSWFSDDDDREDLRSRGRRGDYADSYSRSYGASSGRSSGRGDHHSGREQGYGSEHGYGGFQGDYGGGTRQGGFGGRGDYDRERPSARGSSLDDHYRSWRDRQIAELDRDYEDYCRECGQDFHREFDAWRRNRRSSTAAGLNFGFSGASGSTGSSGTEGGSQAQASPAESAAAERMDKPAGGSRSGRPRR